MFNEPEWLKLLFLLADTQSWLDELCKDCFCCLPLQNKKKFLRKIYYLTITAAAHIIERHYYKINRYPHAGKFHIPVQEIFHYIREAYNQPVSPLPGSLNFQRLYTAEKIIGYDKNNNPATCITIITGASSLAIEMPTRPPTALASPRSTKTGPVCNAMTPPMKKERMQTIKRLALPISKNCSKTLSR